MSILRGGISSTSKPNEAQDEMIPGLIMTSLRLLELMQGELDWPFR